MTVTEAYLDGWCRVMRAPAIVLGLLALSIAVALPLALVLRGMIAQHLGTSLAAEAAVRGVNWDWWQEFSSQATGIGATFGPAVIGFAAVLGNLSDLLDNRPLATVVAGVVAAWLVLWSFLSGGILDRLARNRRVGAAGFFMASGVHFFRMLRLGVLALLAYALLFRLVHPALFDALFAALTRATTVERTAFAWRVVLYAVFGGLLVGVNVLFDYARIRLVVEDRHSAVGALLAGARFFGRHAGACLGLYALNTLTFLAVVGAYALVAPGAGSGGWTVWVALSVGEALIVARLAVKLQFYASQAALFQGALAHAGHVARPAAVWPESPAADVLRGEAPGE
jgi:hypothetical protein